MCRYVSLEESIYKREGGEREVEELGNGESYLDFKTSQVMPLKKSSSNKRDHMGQYVLLRNLKSQFACFVTIILLYTVPSVSHTQVNRNKFSQIYHETYPRQIFARPSD
jgi:hypothetical protein